MQIKLIAYQKNNVTHQSSPTFIEVIGLEKIQICYIERYLPQLNRLAVFHNAESIEVTCHGYIHRAKITNGIIGRFE